MLIKFSAFEYQKLSKENRKKLFDQILLNELKNPINKIVDSLQPKEKIFDKEKKKKYYITPFTAQVDKIKYLIEDIVLTRLKNLLPEYETLFLEVDQNEYLNLSVYQKYIKDKIVPKILQDKKFNIKIKWLIENLSKETFK